MAKCELIYKSYAIYWIDFAPMTIGHDCLIGRYLAYPISNPDGTRISSSTDGQVLPYSKCGEATFDLSVDNADYSTNELQREILKNNAYMALLAYIDSH